MQQTTLKGRAIFEGRCEAQARVSARPISFLGGVDPTNGKIVEKNHDLYGEYARAVCTSRYVKERVGDCAKKIERSGGHVLTDVCTVVSWTEILGIKTMMTNSAKTVYYAPTLNKTETDFAPLKQCLETALEG